MNKLYRASKVVNRDCPQVVAFPAGIVTEVPGAAHDVIRMSIVSRIVDRVPFGGQSCETHQNPDRNFLAHDVKVACVHVLKLGHYARVRQSVLLFEDVHPVATCNCRGGDARS